jgi:hypothetical protein
LHGVLMVLFTRKRKKGRGMRGPWNCQSDE